MPTDGRFDFQALRRRYSPNTMTLADIPLILPAAGKSSRLGSPKGLRIRQDRTWLETQCTAYREAGGKTVLLVLGYDAEPYLRALGVSGGTFPISLPYGDIQLHLLLNSLPEFGPFSSLQCAGRWICDETDHQATFYLPIDTPLPCADVLNELVMARQPSVRIVEPRFQNRGGHPVLLVRGFIEDISMLDPRREESRLDLQIRGLRDQGAVVSVAVDDPRVLLNLNTPEDWARYFEG